MGTFSFGGIALQKEKFERLAAASETACKDAVKAGAQLLAEKLSAAAPVRTGALQGSIKAGKVEYNAGDGYHSQVGPVGTNHGENLAKIGNILEYGRSNMEPRPWFNPTVAEAEGEVLEAMKAVFTAEQKG